MVEEQHYDFNDPDWDTGDKLALAEYFLHEMQAYLDDLPEGESLKRGKLLDPQGRDHAYLLEGTEESLIRHRVEDTVGTFRRLVSELTAAQQAEADPRTGDTDEG